MQWKRWYPWCLIVEIIYCYIQTDSQLEMTGNIDKISNIFHCMLDHVDLTVFWLSIRIRLVEKQPMQLYYLLIESFNQNCWFPTQVLKLKVLLSIDYGVVHPATRGIRHEASLRESRTQTLKHLTPLPSLHESRRQVSKRLTPLPSLHESRRQVFKRLTPLPSLHESRRQASKHLTAFPCLHESHKLSSVLI